MAKKVLSIIIGVLLALFLEVMGVMLATASIGFQAITVIILGITIIVSFLLWKKLTKNETVRDISIGAFYGSIVYLVLIFLAKTVVFSLLSGITK